MPAKKKTFSFEESIEELDTLVKQLESGELSLEDSLSTFERGIKLTRECQKKLTEAEQKVSLLVGEGENMHLEDFDSDENN